MRQIAQNKQHHWHFSPMTLPYSFSNASNKQQQPPWKAQNKATPTTLVTVTFRMCCRHFPSRDSNPVFASKREHSTLHWLIQCYFRAVVLGSGKSLLLISRSTRKEIASRIPCLLQDSRNKLTRRTRWEREWKKTRLWLASLTDITTCPFSPQLLWIWFPSYVTVYEREDRRCQGIYTRGRFCGIRKSKFLLVFLVLFWSFDTAHVYLIPSSLLMHTYVRTASSLLMAYKFLCYSFKFLTVVTIALS